MARVEGVRNMRGLPEGKRIAAGVARTGRKTTSCAAVDSSLQHCHSLL